MNKWDEIWKNRVVEMKDVNEDYGKQVLKKMWEKANSA